MPRRGLFLLAVVVLVIAPLASGSALGKAPPRPPTKLHVKANGRTSLRLTWKASADRARVTGYYVYRSGKRVATVKKATTTYTFKGLRCGTSYVVGVAAHDAKRVTSRRPTARGRTASCPVQPPPPLDTQAPTPPTNLHVTARSGTSLTVAWSASTDDVGVSGYRLYQTDAVVATTTATEHTLTGLSCGTSYTIAVDAVDAAANASTKATVTAPTDGCPPPAPSGGTLHVDLNTDVDYTDPSLSYYVPAWQLLYSTGLQLYNYPDKPAPAGSMLVPEAAVGFPLITDDGKTYTITVEPGHKFSDGTPVTAANFAYAINRALNRQMASEVTPFVDGTIGASIVGAKDVESGLTTTASGVQVDGDKLIIKLERPDGGFLARLSLPPFQALKTDMAITPVGVSVYPSAGPYHITARAPNSSITLERNQYYTGTRPANADRIEYTIGNTLDTELQRAISGQTDFIGELPSSALAGLAATYGVNVPDGQFHVDPQDEVDYIALNTSRPPFNNVNLRKAVNYAIDRPALLLQRGAYAGTVTDQALPSIMPGYRDAPIYPLDGPDLTTARALAGNSCGTIKVWGSTSSLAVNQANIVKTDLEQIGCTVQLVLMSRAQQFGLAKIRGADYDATIEAWGADYPDPFDFIDTFFDGTTIGPTGNNNYAYFDNSDVNAKLAAANLLTGALRYEAYGNLDIEIMTDHAPIVPFLTRSVRYFNSARVKGYVYQPSLQVPDLNTFFIK